jgi:hypothetical protein
MNKLFLPQALVLLCAGAFALSFVLSFYDGLSVTEDQGGAEFASKVSAQQEVNALCERRRSMFSYFNSKSAYSVVSSLPAEWDMIFFGERHYSEATYAYPQVVSELIETFPQIDCLFLEFGEETEESIDLISKNILSRDILVDVYQLKELIRLAASKGVQVFPVDTLVGLTADQAIETDGLNKRDLKMFENINGLFRSQQCKKAVGVFGRLHVARNQAAPRRALTDLLEEDDFRVVSVNVMTSSRVDSSYGGGVDKSWHWNECSWNPIPPVQTYFSKVSKRMRVPVILGENLNWPSFDLVMMTQGGAYQWTSPIQDYYKEVNPVPAGPYILRLE